RRSQISAGGMVRTCAVEVGVGSKGGKALDFGAVMVAWVGL
ncbi:hypothetical protein A2U01_0118839, partial [Trifolium medium]|nr:hypothetical protein [Trifolium medium]